MRLVLIAAALLMAAPAAARDCKGIVLKDSCQVGGTCPDGPTWKKGDKVPFMGWDVEDGHTVYVEYRIGAIAAGNVRMELGCAMKRL